MCFFFQAEDGIRDLVRSRGLGDVYKRQILRTERVVPDLSWDADEGTIKFIHRTLAGAEIYSVSYTHLTLPTSDLV